MVKYYTYFNIKFTRKFQNFKQGKFIKSNEFLELTNLKIINNPKVRLGIN